MQESFVAPESVLIEPEEKKELGYWKHILLVFIFITITPITILSGVISLAALSKPTDVQAKTAGLQTPRGAQIYAALPNSLPSVSGKVIGDDARILILQKFLEMNRSALTPHAAFLVHTADKYQLDWKLLPAIAQKESGLCRVIPPGTHNCWGWGIHSKGTLGFDNYEEAIETVAKGLKEKYVDKGLTTPEKIMSRYAHPDSTTWADGVMMYMEQIKNLDIE
jgi:hypothetical protein